VELPTKYGIDFQLSAPWLSEPGLSKPPMTSAELARHWKQSDMLNNELREQTACNALNPIDSLQNVSLWSPP
jgi:hypothetical protein